MTDTTDTGGKMYSLAINAPQPLNITFTDGSQLIFPLSGKASFTGDVEESARVFFDAVIRHRDSQLEAERQRADELKINWDAAKNSIQFYKAEIAAMKGDQVPVAYLYSASFERGEVEGQLTDAPGCDMPVYDRPQKPVVLPKSHYICGCADRYMSEKEVKAAIDAAGGIVFTSDERLMQDMSGIVKDGE